MSLAIVAPQSEPQFPLQANVLPSLFGGARSIEHRAASAGSHAEWIADRTEALAVLGFILVFVYHFVLSHGPFM